MKSRVTNASHSSVKGVAGVDKGVADGTNVAVGLTGTELVTVGSMGVMVMVACDTAVTALREGRVDSTGWQASRRLTCVRRSTTLFMKLLPPGPLAAMASCLVENHENRYGFLIRSICSYFPGDQTA